MAGRRNSIQMHLILDALGELDHPTAQDVLGRVRRRYPHVSMATVYRNLNQLVSEGALKRVPFADSPDRYDVHVRAHHHIHCGRCGRYFDIDGSLIGEMVRRLEESSGFSIDRQNAFFTGICPSCRGESK